MLTHERNRSLLRVGLLTVAGAITFAILFVVSTNRVVTADRSDIHLRFAAVDGLLRGDAVVHRGVRVGEIKSIEFGEDAVVVQARLVRAVPLTAGARGAIQPVDMFGRQSLVLYDGEPYGPPLSDGDTISGEGPVSMTNRIEQIGERVSDLLSEGTLADIRALLGSAGDAATGAADVAADVGATARAAERLLDEQGEALGSLFAEVASLVRDIDSTVDPEKLGVLREELTRAGTRLASAAEGADRSMATLERILARLDSRDGTIGLLLNDPSLHEHVVGSLSALEKLLDDVRLNPGRYISFSVF